MREAVMVQRILVYLRGLPGACVAVKIHGSPYQQVGWPDITAVYKPVGWPLASYGIPVYLEIKQPGACPTRVQRHRLRRLQEAGAIAEVVSSVEEVAAVLVKYGVLVASENRLACPPPANAGDLQARRFSSERPTRATAR